jgi:hypothetical protein
MSKRDEQASLAEDRVKCGHGGRRAGGGRKPNGCFAPVAGDLIYAKKLLSSLMRDESQPTLLRARCALAIATRGSSNASRIRAAEADADPRGGNPADKGEAGEFIPEVVQRLEGVDG